MTTLTATTAAEQLLADVRQLLARHDGAETLDELRELADEFTSALRRARGRIARIAKSETDVAAEKPTVEQAPPVTPTVEPSPVAAPHDAAPVSVPDVAPTASEPAAGAMPPPARPPRPPGPASDLPRRGRRRWAIRAAAVVAVLVLVALAALVGAAWGQDDDYLRQADPENPVSVRGCVIRFDELSASGASVVPRIHANGTHMCIGVTSVAVDWSSGYHRGELVLRNDGGPGTVVSISVTSDETLTARGITCGPSGGGIVTRLRCYDRDGTYVPAYSKDRMYHPYANLWIGFTMWQPS